MEPKTEQNRPLLPWTSAPVPLPDDFPVSCSGRFVQRDRPITKLHRHDVPEIGVCHNGSGLWVVEGKVLPFSEGDVTVITPDEVHLAQSRSGTVSEWSWIYFDPVRLFASLPGGASAADMQLLSGPGFRNVLARAGHPELNRLALQVVAEFHGRRPHRRSLIVGLLCTMVSLLKREAVRVVCEDGGEAGHPSGRRYDLDRVGAAVEHMCRHYAEPVSVEQLAELSCMSPTHFRRVFTRAMARGPSAYLSWVRVSMAAAELRSSGRPISEIAFASGFPTLSAFNRMFRKLTGVTPREYRSQREAS
jgi:AraC-like DNA-binding protein